MKGRYSKEARRTLPVFSGISPSNAYVTLAVLAMIVLFLCFLLSRGELLARYFFYDTIDTGMDFFHSIEYVRGKTPYELFNTLYPPLANLFFYVIYLLIPEWVSSNWAPTFGESISMRGTFWDLRVHQAPMLIFLVLIILFTWVLFSLIISILKGFSFRQANSVAICLLLCPGMMLAIERGNILFIVVPLTLFFVCFRNSSNKIVRELALLSLAVAAGMKLYPAFFGVLLLRDRQFKAAIRTIIYGILSVVLPMLFFEEGIGGIVAWLSVVFDFSGNSSGGGSPWIGTGFANILHRGAMYLNRFLHIKISTRWFAVAGYVVALSLLAVSLIMKKEWQSTLAITLAMIMFQSQGGYVYSFMVIPAAFFFAQEEKFEIRNFVPFLLITLLTIHLPLFYTRDMSYPDVAMKQFFSLLLVCWCFITPIVDLIRKTFGKVK